MLFSILFIALFLLLSVLLFIVLLLLTTVLLMLGFFRHPHERSGLRAWWWYRDEGHFFLGMRQVVGKRCLLACSPCIYDLCLILDTYFCVNIFSYIKAMTFLYFWQLNHKNLLTPLLNLSFCFILDLFWAFCLNIKCAVE